LEISPEVKEALKKDIKHRLASQKVKVQATVEVTCFTAEGVDAIIPALRAGKNSGKDIQINIISPPQYAITTTTADPESAITIINCAIDIIKSEIEKRNGALIVRAQVLFNHNIHSNQYYSLQLLLFDGSIHPNVYCTEYIISS
jgi:translation initiation factor 2 alpha subunit (eIF-2alpha)